MIEEDLLFEDRSYGFKRRVNNVAVSDSLLNGIVRAAVVVTAGIYIKQKTGPNVADKKHDQNRKRNRTKRDPAAVGHETVVKCVRRI